MTMQTIRIVLAEDHALMRAGIRALLRDRDGMIIVGEAGTGHEALELVRRQKPHLLLTDISMPGLNGLDLTARVVKEHPDTRVIILSMHANEEYVLRALRSGARAYVLKDAETAELELAIRTVVCGKTFLSPSVSGKVIDDYLARVSGKKDAASPSAARHDILTSRQREILQMIAEGNSNKDIANTLDLSIKTVETHRTQIMKRLDIHDTAGLVRYAIRTGLISST
jgi:DNA-binding NarL/FixJ family response regulator